MKRLLIALLLVASGVAADAPYPPQSIYNLPAALTDQSGTRHGLDVHHGHPVLITMFYGNCPMTCPLLIDTLRTIERSIGPQQQAQLRVLMISIDPQHDTVENLRKLARTRRIDGTRWTLARTDAATVRKIAALLNIQYRQLPTGGYNHSSIISVLTADGEIAVQSSALGKADPAVLAVLARLASVPRASSRPRDAERSGRRPSGFADKVRSWAAVPSSSQRKRQAP